MVTPTTTGTLITSVPFDGTNGAGPTDSVVEGSTGNFYGTATNGGASNDGTVFTITFGSPLTALYSFSGPDGANPVAGLLRDNGNFYGTTSAGGASHDGTVFKITAGGTLTSLFSFDGTDGKTPEGVLVQVGQGNFYGTTLNGGAYDDGTVFTLSVPDPPQRRPD
jgi:uncharacterized repeat protein (TIGR03803 family)